MRLTESLIQVFRLSQDSVLLKDNYHRTNGLLAGASFSNCQSLFPSVINNVYAYCLNCNSVFSKLLF